MNEITDEINTDEHTQVKQPQKTSSTNLLSLLEGRRTMYVKASAVAKANGETSKARRLERQLKVNS